MINGTFNLVLISLFVDNNLKINIMQYGISIFKIMAVKSLHHQVHNY